MTILTAVDGERVPSQPVTIGDELARQFDDDLVVLHVMPTETFNDIIEETAAPTTGFAPAISYGDQSAWTDEGGPARGDRSYSERQGENDAAWAARDVVEQTLEEWGHVQFQGRVGDPTEEIVAAAAEQDARYLVIGGRKRSPVGKAVFGSVTQSVLLAADLPVVTVMHDA